MKRCTDWWGVELTAENEEDEILLKKLFETLKDDADEAYESGGVSLQEKPLNQYVSYSGLTITMSR